MRAPAEEVLRMFPWARALTPAGLEEFAGGLKDVPGWPAGAAQQHAAVVVAFWREQVRGRTAGPSGTDGGH